MSADPADSPRPRLSVVIVAYRSAADLERSLPPLVGELDPGDELIVVDNAADPATRHTVERLVASARLLAQERNLGFAAGANAGAAVATGDLLVLLNPDCVVEPGFAEAIRRPLTERRGWDAWMGLLTQDGGTRINTKGTVVHFTGISWSGGIGEPLAAAPTGPHEVAALSGACLAIPLPSWWAAGGFAEDYFMYCEDLDLSLRLRLRGGRLGIEPAARAEHDYAFDKGRQKWLLLERNRLATVIRTYPPALLAACLPALLATELGLLAVAAAGGWLPEKLRANAQVARALPRLLRERRAIQAARSAGAGEIAAQLTAELSSPYLGAAARFGPLRWALGAYWGMVRALVGVRRGRPPQ